MTVGVVYAAVFVCFLCFIAIPFDAVRDVINPDANLPVWEFLFGNPRSLDSPSRPVFALLLSLYVFLYGTIAFVLFVRR